MQWGQEDISPGDVSAAVKLERAGIQSLRKISAKQPTAFQFSLPHVDGSAALVRITVRPIQRDDSHHPLYNVSLQYETAHPHHPVDQTLVGQVQCVYNAYIQATRWTFDFGCFVRCRELLPCSICPATPEPSRTIVVGRGTTTIGCSPTPESTTEYWQPLSVSNTERAQSLPEARNVSRGTLKANIGLKRSGGADLSGLSGRKRPRQEVDDIIKALIRNILEGSKENAKRGYPEAKALEEFSDLIISKFQDVQNSDDLNQALLKLDAEFTKNKKNVKQEAKISVWFNWYFSSCLQHFRHRINTNRGDRGYDQRSHGVEVLHSIINILLFTDGHSALSVITSLAAKQHFLTAAAMRKLSDRQAISAGVAKGLQGKLQLPIGFRIPNPICWVNLILDKVKSFIPMHGCHTLQAYEYLDIPNLAVLRLHEPAEDGKLPMTVPLSVLQARWGAFENTTPRVGQLRRLLDLSKRFNPPSDQPLSQLQESIASFESGAFDQARTILERSEGDVESGHTQNQPEDVEKRLDSVGKAVSLLSSSFSRCIRDSLEPTKEVDFNDTFGRPGSYGNAWDPIGDWSGTATSHLADLEGNESLLLLFT